MPAIIRRTKIVHYSYLT